MHHWQLLALPFSLPQATLSTPLVVRGVVPLVHCALPFSLPQATATSTPLVVRGVVSLVHCALPFSMPTFQEGQFHSQTAVVQNARMLAPSKTMPTPLVQEGQLHSQTMPTPVVASHCWLFSASLPSSRDPCSTSRRHVAGPSAGHCR